MILESALLKQILANGDFETWNGLKEHYFPEGEYRKLWRVVDKHVHKYNNLPTFEDLKLEVRSRDLQEKIYAIETVETDIESILLLDYLKNQFTQSEILSKIENYVDHQVAISDARENIDLLQEIVVQVEDAVDTNDEADDMNTVELFDSAEDLAKFLPLGLNQEYDLDYTFSPKDLVVIGGHRGGGKSFTCCNIAAAAQERGKSALYFTIEMDTRQMLQRICGIQTGINSGRIKAKNLTPMEWDKVAQWWAARFDNGTEAYNQWRDHEDFDKFHYQLSRNKLADVPQIDIHYDPSLTLAKIISVVRQKQAQLPNLGIVIVDYLNQVRRHNAPSRSGQYDWTEQIEVSKKMKLYAQEYETLVFAPYQTDASGEARFAKGILDAADAAYALETWEQQDECMTFNCVKMRSNRMESFTSTVDWETLKIGPQSAINPKEREAIKDNMATGENVDDI